MQNLSINWKTSLAGLGVIAAAALHTFFGVNIPGFSTMDLGTAIMTGIGLIMAKDGAN